MIWQKCPVLHGRHGQLFEGVIFYALWSKVLIYRKYSCNVSSFRSTVCGRAASFGFYEVGLNIFIGGTTAPDIQIKKKNPAYQVFVTPIACIQSCMSPNIFLFTIIYNLLKKLK